MTMTMSWNQVALRRRYLPLFACAAAAACQAEQRDFSPQSTAGETRADAGGGDGNDNGSVSAGNGETGVASGATDEVTSTAPGGTSPDERSVDGSAGEASAANGETAPGVGATSEPSESGAGSASPVGTAEPEDTNTGVPSTSGSSETPTSLCDQNLLINGSFELEDDSWTASSSYAAFEQRVHPLIVTNDHESLAPYEVTAHDGSRFAFLGDVPDDEYMGYHTTLTQPIFVPEEAMGLVLLGYVWVDTNESDEQEWDRAYVQLESQENSEDYWQFAFWTNRDAGGGWVKVDEYIEDLEQVRGKHVNVVVQAVTDQSTPTRFWFDELEVVVVCP